MPVSAADGKLLILTAGLGAVSTTFFAGVEAIRRGTALPIGSISQMQTIRLGRRSEGRNPRIRELVPLAGLGDLEFAGWDPVPDDAYAAARRAAVLNPQDLEPLRDFLERIRPMPAAFDREYVRRLEGGNVKRAANKWELAQALREDIRNARSASGAARTVLLSDHANGPSGVDLGGDRFECFGVVAPELALVDDVVATVLVPVDAHGVGVPFFAEQAEHEPLHPIAL